MTREDIVKLFARRQDAWEHLDSSALARDHAEDCIVESPLAGGNATGREAIERLYTTYFRAFTDMKFQQETLLIDGDQVALFARASGTDRGGFMGMEPTGRFVSISIVFFYELH